MSLYTPKLKAAVHSIPVPHDLVMDVVEYPFNPPYLALRFYESHWRHMSERHRRDCAVYLDTIKRIIEAHGIMCTLDPVYDYPSGQTL